MSKHKQYRIKGLITNYSTHDIIVALAELRTLAKVVAVVSDQVSDALKSAYDDRLELEEWQAAAVKEAEK